MLTAPCVEESEEDEENESENESGDVVKKACSGGVAETLRLKTAGRLTHRSWPAIADTESTVQCGVVCVLFEKDHIHLITLNFRMVIYCFFTAYSSKGEVSL